MQHIIGATTSPFPISIFPRKGQDPPAKSREGYRWAPPWLLLPKIPALLSPPQLTVKK